MMRNALTITVVACGLLAAGQTVTAGDWSGRPSDLPGNWIVTLQGIGSAPTGDLYDDDLSLKAGIGAELTLSRLVRDYVTIRLSGQMSGARFDVDNPPLAPVPQNVRIDRGEQDGTLYRVMVGVGLLTRHSSNDSHGLVYQLAYDIGITVNDINYVYYVTNIDTDETTRVEPYADINSSVSQRLAGSITQMFNEQFGLSFSGMVDFDLKPEEIEAAGNQTGWMFDIGVGLMFWM